jgi:hypothetical protein
MACGGSFTVLVSEHLRFFSRLQLVNARERNNNKKIKCSLFILQMDIAILKLVDKYFV